MSSYFYKPKVFGVFFSGMRSLKELDLSRCLKVNDAGIGHVVSISTLERLFVSETGVSANGVKLLSSLKNLIVLDLGGLPVTDQALSSLQVLNFFPCFVSFILISCVIV